MQVTDAHEVVMAINAGLYDDELDKIGEAMKERRAELKTQRVREAMASFKKGDRVRIRMDAPLKPRYILGAHGTIDSVRLTKIGIKMDDDIHDPYGKWAGRVAIVGAEHVEAIDG